MSNRIVERTRIFGIFEQILGNYVQKETLVSLQAQMNKKVNNISLSFVFNETSIKEG